MSAKSACHSKAQTDFFFLLFLIFIAQWSEHAHKGKSHANSPTLSLEHLFFYFFNLIATADRTAAMTFMFGL